MNDIDLDFDNSYFHPIDIMFLSSFSSRTVAAVSCAVVVVAASGIHGESYLRSSTHAATAQQHQSRDLQAASLLPPEVLAIIPPFCQVAEDSALNEAISCAMGSMLQCAGLLGVLDQFEDLIPSNADDITSCQAITDPFCEIATKCTPCLAQFEALTRCIVEESDEGLIDASIINLLAGCSLACDGSSEGEATVIEIVDVEEDIPVTVVVAAEEESEDEAPEPVPEALDDIPGTAIGAGIFTTLVTALDAAGLVETLSGPKGPYTVFAPTDTAFDNLPEGLVSCLLQDLPTLTDILLYHVTDGAVLASQLSDGQTIPTLLPQQAVTVNISSRAGPQGSTAPRVQINGSTVTTADVMTSNGVIHIVDAVLVPSTIDIEAYLQTCTEDDEDSTYDDTDTNTGLPGVDIIGDIFGDIFNPDNGGGSDGNGDGSSGDLGGLDDIDVESIGTAIGNAVGSFLGDDVGAMIGNAFNSFVSSLGDIFANNGDGSGWLGGMSGGSDNGGSGVMTDAGGWFGNIRKRN